MVVEITNVKLQLKVSTPYCIASLRTSAPMIDIAHKTNKCCVINSFLNCFILRIINHLWRKNMKNSRN